MTWPSWPSSTLTDLAALLKAWSHHWNSNSSALEGRDVKNSSHELQLPTCCDLFQTGRISALALLHLLYPGGGDSLVGLRQMIKSSNVGIHTWPCLPRPTPSLHPFPTMWLLANSILLNLRQPYCKDPLFCWGKVALKRHCFRHVGAGHWVP